MNYIELHTDTQCSDVLSFISPYDVVSLCSHFDCTALAITDRNSTQAYLYAEQIASERGIHLIYGLTIDCLDRDDRYAVTLLAKNNEGRTNLFTLIHLLNENIPSFGRCVTRDQLEAHRSGLLVGASAHDGQLSRAIMMRRSDTYLKQAASFYDYIEFAPEPYDVSSKLCQLFHQFKLPFCAVQNAHITSEIGSAEYHAYCAVSHYWGHQETPNEFLSPTELAELFGELYILPHERDVVNEALSSGPQYIYSQIEQLPPLQDVLCRGASDSHRKAMVQLRQAALASLHRTYGTDPDPIAMNRMEIELAAVDSAGAAEELLLLERIANLLHEKQYPLLLSGTWYNSLLLYLLGVTDMDPLPNSVSSDGFDFTHVSMFMDPGNFMSAEIRVPSEALPLIHKKLACIYQSRLLSIQHKNRTAETDELPFEIMEKYISEVCSEDVRKQLEADGSFCYSVQHGARRLPGQSCHSFLCILPDDERWKELPITRHNEYLTAEMDSSGWRLALPHVLVFSSPGVDALFECQSLTGHSFAEIPREPTEVFTALSEMPISQPVAAACTVAGHPFKSFFAGIYQALAPKDLKTLSRVFNLSHGTGIWTGNQQPALHAGKIQPSQLITCREDVYRYLISRGVAEAEAAHFMDDVRKGRIKRDGLSEEAASMLEQCNAETWFIDVCKNTGYLFPEGHSYARADLLIKLVWYALHGTEDVRAYLDKTADFLLQDDNW